jgi:hypothetical protein
MLERWRVLPPDSPRSAVHSIGIDVRKVVMRGSDPIKAAERFLRDHPTDLVVLAAHAHAGACGGARTRCRSPSHRRRPPPPSSCPTVARVSDPAPTGSIPEPALEAVRRLV